MSATPTIQADSIAPPRAGTLGLSCPKGPTGLGAYEALIELTHRTGDTFELLSWAGGWFVWNSTVGDAAGEGTTREAAIESALGNV